MHQNKNFFVQNRKQKREEPEAEKKYYGDYKYLCIYGLTVC